MINLKNVDVSKALIIFNEFMRPAFESAISSLSISPGSHGLDVGCGCGRIFPLLAKKVGREGKIIGIDISRAHLDEARKTIDMYSLNTTVNVEEADLRESLRFPDSYFDWAWSSDTIFRPIFQNPIRIVRELTRVIKPGGIIALFYTNYSRAMLMPGYRRIEKLMTLTRELGTQQNSSGDYLELATNDREQAFEWLLAAGLDNISISNHIVQYQQPFTNYTKAHLQNMFDKGLKTMEKFGIEVGLKIDEIELCRDLFNPSSSNYLLNKPLYYCFQFGTLTSGIVT